MAGRCSLAAFAWRTCQWCPDAVLAANLGPDAIDDGALRAALDECRRRSFDEVAAEYGLPERIRRALFAASADLAVTVPLEPYADLDALAELRLRRFLVTTGPRRFQESKIAALDIDSLFDAVYIDALDDPRREGKERIFQKILTDYDLLAAHVAVVGDSERSEIAAGNRLGMITIQVLRRRVEPTDHAGVQIRSLWQLEEVLEEPSGR